MPPTAGYTGGPSVSVESINVCEESLPASIGDVSDVPLSCRFNDGWSDIESSAGRVPGVHRRYNQGGRYVILAQI